MRTLMWSKLGLDPDSDAITCPPWELVHITEPRFLPLQNESNTGSMHDNTKKPVFAVYPQSPEQHLAYNR